jgi:hypothetical protein
MISFLLFLLLLVFSIKIIKTKQEGLENYGYPDEEKDAPVAFKTITNFLKYPSQIEDSTVKNEIESILQHERYNNDIFNHNSLQKHYANSAIENDIKHFNNTSNIILYHYNNTPEIQ